MVEKLNEISLQESMKLPKNILQTIIDVSNGDMRKAIMLLQNFKYSYNFKQILTKKFSEMTNSELKSIMYINTKTEFNPDITEEDIYDIAATITLQKATDIINTAIKCKNVVEISNLCKSIIAIGFPIDNILLQLNKSVLESSKLNVDKISKIIIYSGDILLKMKECGNEYIQLLNYLTTVNRVGKNLD